MVACNMRFHPAAGIVKQLVDKGDLGKLHFMHSEYGYYLPYQRPGVDYKKVYAAHDDEGGIILDAIHEINLMRWLSGEVIESDCWGHNSGSLEITGFDTAFLLLKFANNTMGEIRLDYLQKAKRRFYEYVFEKGTILWESSGKNPEYCEVKLYDDASKKWETIYKNSEYDVNEMFVKQQEYFLECVSEKKDTFNTAWDGYRDLEASLELKRKAKERGSKDIGTKA
ncbi:MAG TPA: Gfo/Idh/MocA family oxidoreductase [Nitrospirae bacterium]|nr:Gfo/Idh/MocA family oxidoreductase [Nitrospirota bacterium]